METNTNVGIAQSHIHLDDHHAQPRIQCATSVEKLDIGTQDAMEECLKDNSNPTKEQRKRKVEDQRKLMTLALIKITTSMKSILQVFHNINPKNRND